MTFRHPLILSKSTKYILVGAGGSGKDHTKNICVDNGFKPDVSFTTRPMRDNEVNGRSYNYIDLDTFSKMLDENEFVQYNLFGNGHYYGTSVDSWNNNNIFILDPKTCQKLSEKGLTKGMVIVWFNISEDVRRARLMERNDNNDSLERRLLADREDFIGFTCWNVEVTDPNFEVIIVD